MRMNKKGQLSNAMLGLLVFGVVLVAFAVTMAIGQNIVGTVGADFTANSYEANSTVNVQEGMATLTGQTNNIALIAVLTVIIAALFGALGFIIARGRR